VILAINSALWSPHYDNSELPGDLPDTHMDWVEEQLEEARERGDKVLIVSHVPPGK